MAPRSNPAYGTPNWELIGRWLELAPEDDGPFWALNLMRYHPVAQYGEDAPAQSGTRSGKEADDAYAPLGPLAAIGAMVAFHGDVLEQRLGEPQWDRVGIVRYPSRAAFFAMQQRDDFKAQHVHKEAGMAFTIVMSCLPTAHGAAVPEEAASVVLVVERGDASPEPLPAGATEVAAFAVEGVIVGDERRFDRARFVRITDAEAGALALDALVDAASRQSEAHALVVDRAIDNLIESIATAPSAGR